MKASCLTIPIFDHARLTADGVRCAPGALARLARGA